MEVKIETEKKPGEGEPEKTVTTDTTTKQAVSNEPGAPIVETKEHEERKEK